jgi:hypothetical protein
MSTKERLYNARTWLSARRDAVRMHILTPAEELLYFETCLRGEKTVRVKAHTCKVKIAEHDRKVDTDALDLHDLGRLMLNLCRPEELPNSSQRFGGPPSRLPADRRGQEHRALSRCFRVPIAIRRILRPNMLKKKWFLDTGC